MRLCSTVDCELLTLQSNRKFSTAMELLSQCLLLSLVFYLCEKLFGENHLESVIPLTSNTTEDRCTVDFFASKGVSR